MEETLDGPFEEMLVALRARLGSSLREAAGEHVIRQMLAARCVNTDKSRAQHAVSAAYVDVLMNVAANHGSVERYRNLTALIDFEISRTRI